MADVPDIFGDGFSLTVGPFGVIVTVTRVVPPASGAGVTAHGPLPTEPVGRFRLSHGMAQELASRITQLLQQQAAQGQGTITH